MSKPGNIGLAILGGMLAALGLGWLIIRHDGDGDVIDSLGDVLVNLTSSEEGRLQQLQPETQSMVRQLIQQLANAGLAIHVGQSLRTTAEEKSVIAAGKSGVKSHSWHEIGRAVDLYPINPDTGAPDLDGLRDDLFQQMQQAAVAMGFDQIAYNPDWSRRLIKNNKGKLIWDGGHIQWQSPYASIGDAVAAEGAQYGIA
jgi:hypothetical protein